MKLHRGLLLYRPKKSETVAKKGKNMKLIIIYSSRDFNTYNQQRLLTEHDVCLVRDDATHIPAGYADHALGCIIMYDVELDLMNTQMLVDSLRIKQPDVISIVAGDELDADIPIFLQTSTSTDSLGNAVAEVEDRIRVRMDDACLDCKVHVVKYLVEKGGYDPSSFNNEAVIHAAEGLYTREKQQFDTVVYLLDQPSVRHTIDKSELFLTIVLGSHPN